MKMYKVLFAAVLLAFPVVSVAQSEFDKFEDINGVTSIIVNQKAFSLMSKIGSESDDEYLDLIKDIESLKVFATEDKSVGEEMAKEASNYLKKSNLEELMRVKDDGSNVAIYIREGGSEDYVKELFMLVKDGGDDKEIVIISLIGNIDLKQIAKLTEKMNLPGGEHLKKVNK